MKRYKIGIDCRMYSSSFTGIGRYVFELVENLQKIDSKNDYFLFFSPSHFDEVKLYSPNFHKVLADSKYYSFSEQTHFLKLLNSYHLDLMHFTHFNAPLFYSRRSIVTIHDLTLHFFPGKKMSSLIRRIAYHFTIQFIVKKAIKIIAVSFNTKNDLLKILKVPAAKISVVYEGINAAFEKQKNSKKLSHTMSSHKITSPFLLYTGVWRDHKNLLGLIQSFKILKNIYKIPHQLVITGKLDNPYASNIFEFAATLIENNDIIFPGHVSESDLINLISAAELYVFPSFYEGFGLPPLEAMACGTPAIVSNTSSMPEICGNAAAYFDPYEPEDMADKIHRLLIDETQKKHLISLGSKHIHKFSWPKMAEEIHSIYLHSIDVNL